MVLSVSERVRDAEENWATINEACRFFHRSRYTIYDWIHKGRLDTRTLPSGRQLVRLQDKRHVSVEHIIRTIPKRVAKV